MGRGMGDPPRGGVVDSGLGDLGDGIEGDAARGLERKLAGDHFHRLVHRRRIHVVEQHRVGQPDLEHLAQLIERIDLDLDLDQVAGGGLRALERRADSSGDGDVVVLDQHGIVEAEAMVETAAAAHRVLLQGAQARRGLARAANARARARDAAHEFMRRRRHSERWPSRLGATRSAESTARAGPVTVMSAVFAATADPSRVLAAISVSPASLAKVAATSGSPEITPAARATTIARAGVSSGMVAVAVMSPARPRSSASARVTAASISSGDRKASGQRRERVMLVLLLRPIRLISFSDLPREGKDP